MNKSEFVLKYPHGRDRFHKLILGVDIPIRRAEYGRPLPGYKKKILSVMMHECHLKDYNDRRRKCIRHCYRCKYCLPYLRIQVLWEKSTVYDSDDLPF